MQATHRHEDHDTSLLAFANHHSRDLGLVTKSFSRGTVSFVPHDETNSVLILRSGRLRVSVPTEAGQNVFLADLGPGEIVGEVSAITGHRQATVVEALDDTDSYVFTRAAFLRVLKECPQGALQVMKSLCERLKSLNQRHIENVSLPMSGRLAAELRRLMREGADGRSLIESAPTHAELAEKIGSHREMVTKELRRLAGRGTLRAKRGLIEILRPDDLVNENS